MQSALCGIDLHNLSIASLTVGQQYYTGGTCRRMWYDAHAEGDARGSVKFLEVPAASLVQAIEKNLSAFVVNVIGSGLDVVVVDPNINEGPLYLKYDEEEDERGSSLHLSKRNMGQFHILIFLPPTSHLLFQMEVGFSSTLEHSQ
ncbi:AP-5 complex subunit beta-1 like protein [Tanacetum coccineum]